MFVLAVLSYRASSRHAAIFTSFSFQSFSLTIYNTPSFFCYAVRPTPPLLRLAPSQQTHRSPLSPRGPRLPIGRRQDHLLSSPPSRLQRPTGPSRSNSSVFAPAISVGSAWTRSWEWKRPSLTTSLPLKNARQPQNPEPAQSVSRWSSSLTTRPVEALPPAVVLGQAAVDSTRPPSRLQISIGMGCLGVFNLQMTIIGDCNLATIARARAWKVASLERASQSYMPKCLPKSFTTVPQQARAV